MPIYKDEEGNVVEGLKTADEVQAELEAKAAELTESFNAEKAELEENFQKQLTAKADELSQLEKDRKDITENISKEGDKNSSNFKVLKDALDRKDEEIKGLQTEINETKEVRVNDFKDEMVAQFSDGDDELKKKIEFNFNETLKSMKAVSKEEIAKKVESAFRLSADDNTPNPLDKARNSNSYTNNKGGDDGGVEFTAKEKGLGSRLGITDEDYKKYGPRLKQNSNG